MAAHLLRLLLFVVGFIVGLVLGPELLKASFLSKFAVASICLLIAGYLNTRITLWGMQRDGNLSVLHVLAPNRYGYVFLLLSALVFGFGFAQGNKTIVIISGIAAFALYWVADEMLTKTSRR